MGEERREGTVMFAGERKGRMWTRKGERVSTKSANEDAVQAEGMELGAGGRGNDRRRQGESKGIGMRHSRYATV